MLLLQLEYQIASNVVHAPFAILNREFDSGEPQLVNTVIRIHFHHHPRRHDDKMAIEKSRAKLIILTVTLIVPVQEIKTFIHKLVLVGLS